MRLLVDILIALMLITTLAGVLYFQQSEEEEMLRVHAVQQAMRSIESESLYRAALGEAEATPRGYARYLSLAWFDHEPRNLFVDEDRRRGPWIEHIDMETERELANPRRIIADEQHPPFWYNPYRGVVRARVPKQLSQRGTLELYNLVNGTRLRSSDVDWPKGRWVPGVAMNESSGSSSHGDERDDPILRNLRGGDSGHRTQ